MAKECEKVYNNNMSLKETFCWEKHYEAGVSWRSPLEATPVHVCLERTVKKFPQKAAFDFLGAKFTWEQIGRHVDELAAGLQARGLVKGDRVGLLLPKKLKHNMVSKTPVVCRIP